MKYLVKVPPTAEQGSYKTTVTGGTFQTYHEEALDEYNGCRSHDGLPPVKRMPAGTTYTKIREYSASFIGRENGAIGIRYKIETTTEGADEESARLNLYNRFEHISALVLTEGGE